MDEGESGIEVLCGPISKWKDGGGKKTRDCTKVVRQRRFTKTRRNEREEIDKDSLAESEVNGNGTRREEPTLSGSLIVKKKKAKEQRRGKCRAAA